MRHNKIVTFYDEKQVCFEGIKDTSFSQSPLKPYLLLERIKNDGIGEMLYINKKFAPFTKEDFLIAHTDEYVTDFMTGKGLCNTNSLPWSTNLVESVGYTTASLYNAIKYAVENPDEVTFSPTSGFHHAGPRAGSGFCTFSGQVIASVKIYQELGLSGCYFDLDGHYGNSIEDSREFVPNLNEAVPRGCNINPSGRNETYMIDLKKAFMEMEKKILNNEIHYIVWCHGADSHIDDDLGGQVDTKYWNLCSSKFYSWVKKLDKKLGRPIPVILSLFGGYRRDNYDAVLNLHISDLIKCKKILCSN